jgi:hypothetical protein
MKVHGKNTTVFTSTLTGSLMFWFSEKEDVSAFDLSLEQKCTACMTNRLRFLIYSKKYVIRADAVSGISLYHGAPFSAVRTR